MGCCFSDSSSEGQLRQSLLQASYAAEVVEKLRPILNELIVTERSYVRMLRMVEETFIGPLEQSSASGPDAVLAIFSCWRQFHDLHQELLSDLADATLADKTSFLSGGAETAPTNFLDSAVSRAASAIRLKAPYFLIYSQFGNNFMLATCRLAEEIRTNAAFRRTVEANEKLPQCKSLPLTSYLIQPMQRICKYPLLLRELDRAMRPERLDPPEDGSTRGRHHRRRSTRSRNEVVRARDEVQRALRSLEQAVSRVNEAKRGAELMQRAYQLDTAFRWDAKQAKSEGWTVPSCLLQPHRSLLKEGRAFLCTLKPIKSKAKRFKAVHEVKDVADAVDVYLWLFSDLLVIATECPAELLPGPIGLVDGRDRTRTGSAALPGRKRGDSKLHLLTHHHGREHHIRVSHAVPLQCPSAEFIDGGPRPLPRHAEKTGEKGEKDGQGKGRWGIRKRGKKNRHHHQQQQQSEQDQGQQEKATAAVVESAAAGEAAPEGLLPPGAVLQTLALEWKRLKPLSPALLMLGWSTAAECEAWSEQLSKILR